MILANTDEILLKLYYQASHVRFITFCILCDYSFCCCSLTDYYDRYYDDYYKDKQSGGYYDRDPYADRYSRGYYEELQASGQQQQQDPRFVRSVCSLCLKPSIHTAVCLLIV